jgi:hypothetical protein
MGEATLESCDKSTLDERRSRTMTEILADVNVCYDVEYIPPRGRKHRRARLWTMRKVSIAVPSAIEAPSAFSVTSAKASQDPELPFDIRLFDRKLWWPVVHRPGSAFAEQRPGPCPKNAKDFLKGLSSGTYEALHILNPTLLWFGGHQPTYEEEFGDRDGYTILTNGIDRSFAEIQRGAARVMLCGDFVYFAGGTPAFFGCRSDHSTDRTLSLRIGNLAPDPGPRMFGPTNQEKLDAGFEGYAFDLSELRREVASLQARGFSLGPVDKLEGACDIALEDAAHFCADAAVRRLFASSSAISEAYWNLIPGWARHGQSEWVPLDICRTILSDSVGRSWPGEEEWKELTVALACATNVLKRLEMKGELGLAAEDENALASL